MLFGVFSEWKNRTFWISPQIGSLQVFSKLSAIGLDPGPVIFKNRVQRYEKFLIYANLFARIGLFRQG